VAELQRTIVAKLRLDKEGDAEIFGKTADEVEALQKASTAAGTAAEGLGKSFEQGTRAVESGSTRATAAVEKIGVALANYRQRIKEAEAAGATVGDEQIKELRRLEAEYDKAVDSVGELRKAQQQAKRDIDDATEAAGGQAERINSLDDIVRKLAEDLGPGAVKWLSWGTAAAGAFTAGWAAGTKLRGVMNELTGGDFDRFIQKWSGATKAAEAWVDTTENAADAAQRLKNELNTLAHNGIDVAGKSAAEVHQIYVRFTDGLRDSHGVLQQTEADYKKWKESLPPVGAELDKLAKQTAEFVKRFAEENKQLGAIDLARIFGPQIEKLLEQYAQLRQKVPPELQAIADAWKLAGEAAKLSAEQQVSAAGLVVSKLQPLKAEIASLVEVWRSSGQQVPAILALQADAVGVYVSQIERIQPAVNLMTGAVEGGAAGLKYLEERFQSGIKAIQGYGTEAQKLQQILEGVRGTAEMTGDAVWGVFLGNKQVGGAGPAGGAVGYDPLGVYK